MNSISKDGEIGERAFANLCNKKLKCQYLQINQSVESYSSEIWKNREKRPDFLINILNIAPLFIEVKVRNHGYAGTSAQLKDVTAFSEKYKEFEAMENFEKSMGINLWYAFFEKVEGRINPRNAFLIPISRIRKNIPEIIDKENWVIFIPKHCMNDWSSEINLSDKCRNCDEQYCKEPKQ